jgi:hypothetical protein
MTMRQPDPRHPFVILLRRRPTLVAMLGYLVFVAGTLIGIWYARTPDAKGNNPVLILVLIWVIAGLCHIFVRTAWRACVIATIGSGLGYVILVAVWMPSGLQNEMFGAGVILACLVGGGVSVIMGIPVAVYRWVRAPAPPSHD